MAITVKLIGKLEGTAPAGARTVDAKGSICESWFRPRLPGERFYVLVNKPAAFDKILERTDGKRHADFRFKLKFTLEILNSEADLKAVFSVLKNAKAETDLDVALDYLVDDALDDLRGGGDSLLDTLLLEARWDGERQAIALNAKRLQPIREGIEANGFRVSNLEGAVEPFHPPTSGQLDETPAWMAVTTKDNLTKAYVNYAARFVPAASQLAALAVCRLPMQAADGGASEDTVEQGIREEIAAFLDTRYNGSDYRDKRGSIEADLIAHLETVLPRKYGRSVTWIKLKTHDDLAHKELEIEVGPCRLPMTELAVTVSLRFAVRLIDAPRLKPSMLGDSHAEEEIKEEVKKTVRNFLADISPLEYCVLLTAGNSGNNRLLEGLKSKVNAMLGERFGLDIKSALRVESKNDPVRARLAEIRQAFSKEPWAFDYSGNIDDHSRWAARLRLTFPLINYSMEYFNKAMAEINTDADALVRTLRADFDKLLHPSLATLGADPGFDKLCALGHAERQSLANPRLTDWAADCQRVAETRFGLVIEFIPNCLTVEARPLFADNIELLDAEIRQVDEKLIKAKRDKHPDDSAEQKAWKERQIAWLIDQKNEFEKEKKDRHSGFVLTLDDAQCLERLNRAPLQLENRRSDSFDPVLIENRKPDL